MRLKRLSVLNKYLYGNANPVNTIDPSGNFGLGGMGASIGISVSLNVGSVALFGDRSPQAFAQAIIWGTVEGIGFFKAGQFAAKGFKYVKSAYLTREITKTFGIITNRGGSAISGYSHLTTQMAIQTRFGSFHISSGLNNSTITGALKHLVGEVMKKSGGAATTEMAEAIAIKEIKAVLEAATMDGLNFGRKMIVTTSGAQWEIILEASKHSGDLAKLYHLVPIKFF